MSYPTISFSKKSCQYLIFLIPMFLVGCMTQLPHGPYHPSLSDYEAEVEKSRSEMKIVDGMSAVTKDSSEAEGHTYDATYSNRFYLEYDEEGKRFPETKQLEVINRFITTSDKPVYLVVYVNSWHNNANDDLGEQSPDPKYFPYLLARRNFQNPNMNVVGVYIGWRGEKYKHAPLTWLSAKDRAMVADKIGKEGELRDDIIYLVNSVQQNNPSGYSLIMGKSFGGRILSRAFMDYLSQTKSVKDWPLGDHSLLVTLNPAIGADAFDRIYKKMPGPDLKAGLELQRPLWLNLTSDEDFATSWLFPQSRFIGKNLSDNIDGSAKLRKNQTIGHHFPYLSHWVTVNSSEIVPSEKVATKISKIDKRLECTKEDTPWFKIPIPVKDACGVDAYKGCVTRHEYKYEKSNRLHVTTLLPLCQGQGINKNLGYMWNFQTDSSVIDTGSAEGRKSSGKHNAYVQTTLGRMLDEMLFTAPEK